MLRSCTAGYCMVTNSPARWRLLLRALHARNYRLFFEGQTVSLIGTWMTRVATSWLVYRLTDSAFLLGLTSFASQIPILFLAPFAGVWVDRWNRHRTLVVTQILSMLQSFALAALALTRVITVWEILALVLMQGVINSFDMPARQSFVVQMIERREDLGNAIALNSSMVNGARLIGPAVAGVLIAAVGEGYCFLIDGVSYMAVIASLLAMRVAPAAARAAHRSVGMDLKEGWHYVRESAPIRSVLLFLTLVSLVGMPYTVLMPIFARVILGGGAHTLGFLMAAAGLGALAGAVSLAMRRSVLGLGRVIVWSSSLFGLGLIGFGLSHVLPLSLLAVAVAGFGMMRHMASSNTILQTIVEEDKRGRVMAYYSMSFQGLAPFGSLAAGAIAAKVGAPWTIIGGGALCLAGAAWFAAQLPAIRRAIRPIYQELGILPAVPAVEE
ncbi:MAG: MFS transporter [Candidatus Sulfopaludibacter sp.]|nr:MFS transporter [Candidatus Sulfopaludibacter sp.]